MDFAATSNPTESEHRYVQLTRGAFIINDFLQNPHFSNNDTNWQQLTQIDS